MLLAPEFPPLLNGYPVPADGDPMAVARDGTIAGTCGAGDLFWSEAETHAVAAIVLEPEVPLSRALQMAPLMMVAMGDALGAIGPPNLALMNRWPFTLMANGGEVGHVSLHAPAGTRANTVPDYLVIGFSLAISLPEALHAAPGLDVHTTALHEEGCGDLDRTQLIEAIARHFLAWLDDWQERGYACLHPVLVGRMPDLQMPFAVALADRVIEGRLVGIDEEGGALIDGANGVQGISLADVLGIGG